MHSEDVLLSLARPIAVVGNASPTRAWGPVIDRYASVIRLNDFQIQGFEALVGRRTDVRCTAGWFDTGHRADHVELTPFNAAARQAENLPAFNAANARPVLTAYADIRPFIPELKHPSTGLALVQLLEQLEIPADLFGFDGFRSKHYWESAIRAFDHSKSELEVMRSRPHMAVYTPVESDRSDIPGAFGQLVANADATWDWLNKQADMDFSGQRVLELGGLSKNARINLEMRGNRVTSVPVWPGDQPLTGVEDVDPQRAVLDLAFLEQQFDWCISVALLDVVHPNDARIFVRQASRVSSRLLLAVRAKDVTNPARTLEARADMVRPLGWWLELLSAYYDVIVRPCAPSGYYAFFGMRRERKPGIEMKTVDTGVEMEPTSYCIKSNYSPRIQPAPAHYAEREPDIAGKPDVYNLLRDLARVGGCRRILDFGCGQARSLANLHSEFDIVGVGTSATIKRCKTDYAFGTWLEVDFEQPQLPNLNLRDHVDDAIICAGLIEHLVDPTPLMRLLRDLLRHAPFALVTTPERDIIHGPDHQGPPPNPSHVREWNTSELRRYAEANFLDVAFAGLTASRSHSFPLDTSLLLLCGRFVDRKRREAIVLACDVLRGYDALARERDKLMAERDAARAEADKLASEVARLHSLRPDANVPR